MTNQLTVIIPCKNERENMDGCIAAARMIADEILVADSGSTDDTMDVARRLGCRIIEREYIDSGDFKNWAIPQATHDWVLIVDADERITPMLGEEIQTLLAGQPDKSAYSIVRLNYFLGHAIRHGDWARDRVIRLLRRDRCRYASFTDHAEIDLPRKQVGKLRHQFIHYTAWNIETYIKKMSHYASQTADMWHEQGKRSTCLHLAFNAPLRFARSYLLRAGFLDGKIGFHVATLTAYYSFLKQFELWQRAYGRSLRDLEPDHAAERVTDLGATSDLTRARNAAA